LDDFVEGRRIMNDNFNPQDFPLVNPDAMDGGAVPDVPSHLEFLPNGDEILVYGDPEGAAAFNHPQGDNPFGAASDCGLVSCEDILRQFGVQVNETDVVQHAMIYGECTVCQDANHSGGSDMAQEARLLRDYGVPAQALTWSTVDNLAAEVETGHGVIIGVNAGVLWDDPKYLENGDANHAIVVTGVAVDPITGDVQGFYINDSGKFASGKFVDAATMQHAWTDAGGMAVVTDVVH
jgi:hypothetical protein